MFRKSIITITAIMLLTGIISISNGGSIRKALETPVTKMSDREYLRGFITKYLDAMIAHKPESLPVAADVKFTEDCKRMKLGEGLWKNI